MTARSASGGRAVSQESAALSAAQRAQLKGVARLLSGPDVDSNTVAWAGLLLNKACAEEEARQLTASAPTSIDAAAIGAGATTAAAKPRRPRVLSVPGLRRDKASVAGRKWFAEATSQLVPPFPMDPADVRAAPWLWVKDGALAIDPGAMPAVALIKAQVWSIRLSLTHGLMGRDLARCFGVPDHDPMSPFTADQARRAVFDK